MSINLYNGDCLEVLKTINDKSVDIVICDLPYGITICEWDKKIDLNILWNELLRVGKDNTPYFFFCTFRFGVEIVNSNPKMFRYDLVWVKNRLTNALTSTQRIANAHENILVFYKKKPIYNYLKYHKKINNDNDKTYNSYNRITGTNVMSHKKRSYEPPLPLSCISANNVDGSHTKHSTQKPLPIIEMLIKYYSNEGDVVLDPTMGSGSTGVAAKNLGRKFIGIELDEKCFEVAKNRII